MGISSPTGIQQTPPCQIQLHHHELPTTHPHCTTHQPQWCFKLCSFRYHLKISFCFQNTPWKEHGFPSGHFLASVHLGEWLCMGNARIWMFDQTTLNLYFTLIFCLHCSQFIPLPSFHFSSNYSTHNHFLDSWSSTCSLSLWLTHFFSPLTSSIALYKCIA